MSQNPPPYTVTEPPAQEPPRLAQALEVHMLPVPDLLAGLRSLQQFHEDRGRPSHALGVGSAIALVQRTVRARKA